LEKFIKIQKPDQKAEIKSNFRKSVLTLMTGTTIAQAIPIAISPILTRLYSPEEFGLFALFLATVSIFGVVATMRYEMAIVQPEKSEDAINLVLLSAIISTAISLALFICVFVFKTEIQNLLGNTDIGIWLYWVPLAVLLIGLHKSLNYWHVRTKQFGMIAKSKVAKGASMASTQVGLGAMAIAGGLIFGYVVGFFVAVLMLLRSLIAEKDFSITRFEKSRLLKNAKKYKKMPQYSALGALSNTISSQMPVLVISKVYEMSVAGFFSLTIRVLSVPMSLVSEAVGQVLLQKLAEMHHTDPAKMKPLVIKIFLILTLIMVPFTVLIFVFGEDVFAFIFGELWREAGAMASIFVFSVAIRFAVSPLSMVLTLEHNVRLGVIWQSIYLATISCILFVFSSLPINELIIALVAHDVVLYLLYFFLILKGSESLGAKVGALGE
jgi:O-antigen/teichoic acid export membrane protein